MALSVFRSPDVLARHAAREFSTRGGAAIAARGRFAVALSGGTTPRAMLEKLADADLTADVDWDRVHVFWSDERCVPPENEASNYGTARRVLLDRVPLPPDNVHRMRGELEPQSAAQRYGDDLSAFFGAVQPRFDLIYLGLGTDGHTASLFPGTAALAVTNVACVANHVASDAAHSWRLTLTYPAINAGRAVIFLVQGVAKAPVLRQIMTTPALTPALPAQMISPDGELFWFADAAAASTLEDR
ncbi:MAG: 6-phosphogluconolactonase [Candidatus Eremiobacteraeota bacterium]|nr:6-phosphogluconolactonase [Candidatus Eremiobacteraeota bacterium]MBC5827357.1 6-phosphogluconolactonase [Candidatus Eremiobacteraeota bacterium]